MFSALAPAFRSVPLRAAIAGFALLVAGAGLAACSSTTIAVKEAFGISKREQLVARVEDARDQQNEAKEQFASALDEFLAVTGSGGTELEARYRKLTKAFEASESQAKAVSARIRDVEAVSAKLFGEWERELEEYTSDSLRASSQAQLDETRTQYTKLVGVMRGAESKMQPVLAAFRDQVLFLKHNLNAQAISSLGNTAGQIESDVTRLIAEMEASIDEADSFIRQMG